MVLAGVLTASAAAPVRAQEDQVAADQVPADVVARQAGPNVYGAPRWLPLRRDLDGEEVTVGCTYASRGSANGYECGGHHGRWALDFVATTGTPVYSAGAGFATNITAKPGGSGFGNVVRVDHGYGISTVYAHLARTLVASEGEWVDEKTQIGTVGSTGSSSTPHLHFERFALPNAEAGIGGAESVDPGPLYACRGDFLVSFPEAGGFDSWKGLPWGSLTVASDGPACLDAVPTAPPATPILRDLEPSAGTGWSRVADALSLLGLEGLVAPGR